MLRAVFSALATLYPVHLRCVIVCSISRICMCFALSTASIPDGRMALLDRDRERLSAWAHAYEHERGPLSLMLRPRPTNDADIWLSSTKETLQAAEKGFCVCVDNQENPG